MLTNQEREEVLKSVKVSLSLYRFGDGQEIRSKHEITVPMTICGKKIKLQVDVVENDIPLLISRPTMTQLGAIAMLDTANHMVTIEGKQFNLELTESGYHTIPVCEWTNHDYNVIFHLETLAESTKAEKARKAQKLHHQFVHASKERLLQLLRNGGCYDKEFLQEVENCCDSCQFCQKHRKQKPNPIVSFPKARVSFPKAR